MAEVHSRFMDDKFDNWVVRHLPIWLIQRLYRSYQVEQAGETFQDAIDLLDASAKTILGGETIVLFGIQRDENAIGESEILDFEDYLNKKYPDSLRE